MRGSIPELSRPGFLVSGNIPIAGGCDKTHRTDRSHGVVDSTGSQTALDDLETASFPEDHAALVDADILEGDVAVTVWGIVKAHD